MRADRPSSTATLIAAATVFLARQRRLADVVPAGAAPWCARSLTAVSPMRLTITEIVSGSILRWAPWLAERLTIPGLLLHFMLRKRWIEEAVRAGLAQGCEQVVVLGAGFDTLALRLSAELPRTRFIEIDHPATQRCKRRAIEREPAAPNLHLIAADLARERLQQVLLGSGVYRAETRSVFVIEGLLMYLTDDEVSSVFTALRDLQRAPGRVVFTMMEPTSDGKSAFHNATVLVRWLLSHWSEPFKSALPGEDAARFLGRFGYRFTDLARAETLCARYLAPSGRGQLPLAEGEMVVVADCG
jgi:methyltransferase (TIGR00027 family)